MMVETLQLDHKGPGGSEVVMNLWDHKDPQDQWPAFMNLHIKHPNNSAKNDKDVESNLVYSNDWMNSHGIVEKQMW